MSNSRITFQPYHYFWGPPSNQTNEMWRRLSPLGDGIVEVPNEFTKDFPPSLPAPEHPGTYKVYGISMFHQLHCLNFLWFAYEPSIVVDMPREEISYHRDYCLDSIRQVIICVDDATFEPLHQKGINGMGATHRCRNFERIFTWAYENRSDKEGNNTVDGKKHGGNTHTPGHRHSFDD